jgi:hypothetical protein
MIRKVTINEFEMQFYPQTREIILISEGGKVLLQDYKEAEMVANQILTWIKRNPNPKMKKKLPEISEVFMKTYCYCERCKRIFNDIPNYSGNLHCPNCKPLHVVRGIPESELADLATDQDENEEMPYDGNYDNWLP